MASLGKVIGGLGSIAEGAMRGLDLADKRKAREEDEAFQRGQRERVTTQQKLDDDNKAAVRDANAAFARTVKEDQDKFAASGQDVTKYRPNPALQARAFDARAAVLRERGNFDELMKNQAAATPFYTLARNQAIDDGMARYRSDGDIITLAQSVYPHLRDGTEITFAKKLKDDAYEFSLSDGTKQVMRPEEVVGLVTQMRQNPEVAAKAEFERIQQELIAKREEKTAKTKAQLDREGEEQKHGLKLTEIAAETEGKKEVARIGADSRIAVADKKAADAENKPPKQLDSDNLHNLVTNSVPEVRGILDPVTGRYAGTQHSLAITERAQAWIKANPGMTEPEAIRRAANEWKKRQPPGKPKPGAAGLGGGAKSSLSGE